MLRIFSNQMRNLYGYKLSKSDNIVDIGGGRGELALELISAGYNIVAFVEPDREKFSVAQQRIGSQAPCFNCKIGEAGLINHTDTLNCLTIVMQDVIEHIPQDAQRAFFLNLRKNGVNVKLIGRTPNLKSPFGLRNSFGDNTHIYRFTDTSLRDFLVEMGFRNIDIHSEPYKITGLVSLVRSIPYYIILLMVTLSFVAVYGSYEGFMTPNIVFHAQ